MSTEENTAETIAHLVRDSQVFNSDKNTSEVPLAVVREGYDLKDLENFQARPRRIRERISLSTIESFIAYLNEWKQEGVSVIFCDETARSLNAVIDYHEGAGDPTWGNHRASFAAQLSREAKIWSAQNGVGMNQKQFAEFLEERARDVVSPSGALLLELALKLQIVRQGTFGSAIKLQTGEFQFAYTEENQKGTVEVPEIITIGIPLFHNGQPYELQARLRYQLRDGVVTFTYKLNNYDEALEHAFREIVAKVQTEVAGVAVYQGTQGK